ISVITDRNKKEGQRGEPGLRDYDADFRKGGIEEISIGATVGWIETAPVAPILLSLPFRWSNEVGPEVQTG
ncbi:MAG: hypothetical protein Q4F15_04495, partial [Bacillota bacterium]|nr:hypothetical protein [Bacillota bacterium]